MNTLKELLRKNKSVILYLVFGVLTTVIDWGMTFLLYKVWGEAIDANRLLAHGADVIAWVAAVAFAYVTNRIWVFESRRHGFVPILGEIAAFAGGRLLTLALQELLIFVFFTWLGLNKYVVKMASSVLVVIINYFVSKFLVFRSTHRKE